MTHCFKLSLVGRVLAPLVLAFPLSAQPSPPARISLSLGMELHGNWAESSFGPTAAIALLSRVTPHVAIQTMLSGSAGFPTSSTDYLACGTCPRQPEHPNSAIGASAEIVLSPVPNQGGPYFLGGLGVTHYGGGKLSGPRTHAVIDMGIGAPLGGRTSQFFVEARLAYVVSHGAYPSWHAPLRIGWRTRK